MAGLSQLQSLDVSVTDFTGQSVSEIVGAQLRISLIGGAGDLQALQNLNQLTNLNLGCCFKLTGAFR